MTECAGLLAERNTVAFRSGGRGFETHDMNALRHTTSLVLLTSLFGGCDGVGPSPSTGPNTPPAPGGAATPPAVSFEVERARIEAENRRVAEQQQFARGFVTVAFDGFDDRGRVRVKMTNATDKDIDDMRGGVYVGDEGGHVHATAGYTEAVPGSVLLKAGQSMQHAPFLSARPEFEAKLKADPDSVVFWFTAFGITYADGTEQSGLRSTDRYANGLCLPGIGTG